MKRIVTFISIILVSLVIADRFIGWGLDKLYNKCQTGDTGGAVNYYLGLDMIPDVLIMGSSRAHCHVIPDSLSTNAFNLSHNGMKIPFNAGLISVLAENKRLPKHLLLHIQLNSFNFYEGRDLSISDIQHLKYFHGKSPFVTKYINSISKYEFLKYFFKSYRYNGKVLGLIKNIIKPPADFKNARGFKGLPTNASDSLILNRQVQALKNLDYPEESIHYSEVAFKFLDEIISICKKNGTQVTFFTSPLYFESSPFALDTSNKLSAYFDSKNVQYINYFLTKVPELEDKLYWHDFEHLNELGAKLLSNDLKSRLILN